MRHLFLGLIAALSLMVGTAQAARYAYIDYAMDFACNTMNVDCSDLKNPEIVYRKYPVPGLLGRFVYAQPHRIELTQRFRPGLMNYSYLNVEAMGILIHEVVHYVDWHLNGPRGSKEQACVSEGMAWNAYNLYMNQVGRPDLTIYNWREWYRC